LIAARRARRDDFFTQLSDIEKELRHYKSHFADKVVYCNCDDPRASNFFYYFAQNFEHLGLKKLITSCYKNSDIDMFTEEDSAKAVYLEYYGDQNEKGVPLRDDIAVKDLNGDGDFRNPESIELLKQVDIVVTNPPFSLFREYIAQLIEYDKKFLVLGNVSAISYRDIFPLLKDNKVWMGISIKSGDREFGVPDDYPLEPAANSRVDDQGRKYIRVKGVRWFTNLDYKRRHEDILLYETYTPDKYPKYDNYDAISVDKVDSIPKDYKGLMKVPLTFMDKYNLCQFEIIGIDREVVKEATGRTSRFFLDGKELFARVVMRNKTARR
jgi:hypothetical protein